MCSHKCAIMRRIYAARSEGCSFLAWEEDRETLKLLHEGMHTILMSQRKFLILCALQSACMQLRRRLFLRGRNLLQACRYDHVSFSAPPPTSWHCNVLQERKTDIRKRCLSTHTKRDPHRLLAYTSCLIDPSHALILYICILFSLIGSVVWPLYGVHGCVCVLWIPFLHDL